MKIVHEIFKGAMPVSGHVSSAPQLVSITLVGRNPITAEPDVLHLEGETVDVMSALHAMGAQVRTIMLANGEPDPHAPLAKLIETARRIAGDLEASTATAGIGRHRAVVFAAALREALAPWNPAPSCMNPCRCCPDCANGPCNADDPSDVQPCSMRCTCNDAPIEDDDA